MKNKPLITVSDLSYSVSKDRKLLNQLNFEINENEICMITGPNGSGKTTLIKILMGFLRSYSGKVIHHGQKNYSYVPQGFDVPNYINLDVKSFLKFTDIKTGIFKFDDVIELLNLKDLLNINLKNISGGQLRKVLIAKSLLGSDKIIFLDEPTCWLDLESQEEFYLLIQKLISISKISIVIITHDRFLLDKKFAKIISLEKDHVCFNKSALI